MKYRFFSYPLILLLSVMLLSGCHKDKKTEETDSTSTVKKFEKAMMEQFYYWASSMNTPDPQKYDVEGYFNAMLVKQDRWSWMSDGNEYRSNQTGVSTSYGLHLKQPINFYNDYNVYVSYVDANSPVGKAGIKRGFQLTKVNGAQINTLISSGALYDEFEKPSNRFTFKDLSGTERDYNLSQSSYQSKSVIATEIYDHTNYSLLPQTVKVGYINYITFNESMKSEIVGALSEMKSAGITHLILDLRYNGGGDLDLCTDIASLLAPQKADGKTFLQIKHNSSQTANDFLCTFSRSAASLDLEKLYVITSGGTASASESLINGLSPYTDVVTVGETSYGKPNGMYVILYPNGTSNLSAVQYAFYPICFYCLNANGKAEFDNGLTPDYPRGDDLYHDFGTAEDLINSCLTHIATGQLPEATSTRQNVALPSAHGKQIRIPLAEDDSKYGLATKKVNI